MTFAELCAVLSKQVSEQKSALAGNASEIILLDERANSLGYTLHPAKEARLEEPRFIFRHSRYCPETGRPQFKLTSMVRRPKPVGIEKILQRSLSDARWFDAAKKIAVSMLTYGEEMPAELSQFAAGILSGEIQRPSDRGRKARFHRRLDTISLVKRGVEFGFPATRNDESPPESACDAVAYAYQSNGLQPSSFSRVKAIWISRGSKIERNISP